MRLVILLLLLQQMHLGNAPWTEGLQEEVLHLWTVHMSCVCVCCVLNSLSCCSPAGNV